METRRRISGFTLVEILIALGILSVAMAILHGTFSTSSATARAVEQRAEALSSLTGALDTLSREVRGAYEGFSGTRSTMTFTVMTPFREDHVPVAQTLSYEFDDGKLLRTVLHAGPDLHAPRAFLLLDGVQEPSFAFFDGNEWVDRWTAIDRLPGGVRVTFSYQRRAIDTVTPVWTRK
jgi:prepilin-type N-terminal cleavage/methylation domain-containing protein